MDESSLIDKVRLTTESLLINGRKLVIFLILLKNRIFRIFKIYYQTTSLIRVITMPLNDFEDKNAWRFSAHGDFSAKAALY